MTIETDLKSLVEVYAKYNSDTKSYSGEISKEKILILERSFSSLLLKWLHHDGPKKENLDANYQTLQALFEQKPDAAIMPEVLWIEQTLSQGKKEKVCLQHLTDTYQRLVSPEKYKDIKFNEIATRADLIKWLENAKKNTKTYTERSLYNSILSMLDESNGYFDEVGKIRPKGIRALIKFLPIVIVSLGAATVIEELLAIYALYFVLLKSGDYISSSSVTELSAMGKTLKNVSAVTATTTTTIIVRLTEMAFWGTHQCYSATLHVGSTLLDPLIALCVPKKAQTSIEEDLVSASQNSEEGRVFSNYQLKLIASPIESRHGIISQQYFLSMRAGNDKKLELERILLRMQDIDQEDCTLEMKLALVKDLLRGAKKNKDVYVSGSLTAEAIDKAMAFLEFLKMATPKWLDELEAGSKIDHLAVSSL